MTGVLSSNKGHGAGAIEVHTNLVQSTLVGEDRDMSIVAGAS